MTYTNSQIREAFHKAADYFDQHPGKYQFMATTVPECGSPGCMLGMVGAFLGVTAGQRCWNQGAIRIIGVDSETFFRWRLEWPDRASFGAITDYPAAASAFMRWVADTKYADEEQSEQYSEVRKELTRIFAETEPTT